MVVRMTSIDEPAKQLEAASTGEDVRKALIYAIEVANAIHDKKFHGGSNNG